MEAYISNRKYNYFATEGLFLSPPGSSPANQKCRSSATEKCLSPANQKCHSPANEKHCSPANEKHHSSTNEKCHSPANEKCCTSANKKHLSSANEELLCPELLLSLMDFPSEQPLPLPLLLYKSSSLLCSLGLAVLLHSRRILNCNSFGYS